MAQLPPRIIATLDAPASAIGPPTSVAVAADESFAVVSASTRIDPGAPQGWSPDNSVTVIDLTAHPPVVSQQLHAGNGAGGMRLSPDGKLLLMSNRFDGTVSVFAVADRKLTLAGTVMIDPGCQPAGIGFAGDGKTALVSCRLLNKVAVLNVDGTTVTVDPRPITTGVGPHTIMVNPAGTMAAVSNVGRGDGDMDTVSLIELTEKPYRTVQTTSVGHGPEGLRWSPDGRFLANDTQEGTTKPQGNPFRHEQGRLAIYAVEGTQMRLVAEAPIGHWSHGIVFSRIGRTILVQNMTERTIQVFGWDGAKLTPGEDLHMGAGPAAINVAW